LRFALFAHAAETDRRAVFLRPVSAISVKVDNRSSGYHFLLQIVV
jgi:hypothetical protein